MSPVIVVFRNVHPSFFLHCCEVVLPFVLLQLSLLLVLYQRVNAVISAVFSLPSPGFSPL